PRMPAGHAGPRRLQPAPARAPAASARGADAQRAAAVDADARGGSFFNPQRGRYPSLLRISSPVPQRPRTTGLARGLPGTWLLNAAGGIRRVHGGTCHSRHIHFAETRLLTSELASLACFRES